MSIATAKLLKVGGPLLTGIGGVFATSQLVSKSANEKQEEKLKTVALKDEEPVIEDYKDANEGKCKKDATNKCEGGQQGEKSDNQGEQGGGGAGEPSAVGKKGPKEGAKENSEASGANGEKVENGEHKEDEDGPKSETEKGGDESGNGEKGSSKEDEEKQEGLENGTNEAEHLNVHGNAYGTEDRAMTRQDWENFRNVQGSLKGVLNQLTSFVS